MAKTNGNLLDLLREHEKTLRRRYQVTLEFLTPCCGGTPASPQLMQSWIDARVSRGVLGKDEADRIKAETATQYKEDYEDDVMAKNWTRFKVDEDGVPYIEERCVRALLKECAVTLGLTTKHRGSKQILQHGLAVRPLQINFRRDGEIIEKEDGSHERPITVSGPMGTRNALKRTDFVDVGATVNFELMVADRPQDKADVTEDYLAKLLGLAQTNGLGADRSQGFGQFRVIEFKRLEGDVCDHEAIPAGGEAVEAEE